jgi:hypothetical protein
MARSNSAMRRPPSGGIAPFKPPAAPKPKPTLAAPRISPIETRRYGKGLTPLAGAPNTTGFFGGYGMGMNKSDGI